MSSCRLFLVVLSVWVGWQPIARAAQAGASSAFVSSGCAADPIQSPRLPLDWSFAGYQMGAQPLPGYPVRANVRNFGAKGNGKADDTQAILRAIQAAPDGSAVYLPAGRYRITQRIVVCKRAIAIRGDGPGRTTLFFPSSLADLYGDVRGSDGSSGYAHSYGFIEFQGWDPQRRDRSTASVVAGAGAGSRRLVLNSVSGISAGTWVRLLMSDSGDGSLFQQLLFAGSKAPEGGLRGMQRAVRFVSRVSNVNTRDNSITLERQLPVGVQTRWSPQVHAFTPLTVGAGIQDLTMEFPWTRYAGHLKERGYNALFFGAIVHGFISNIRILNADSGIYCWGCVYTTIQDVTLGTTTGKTRGYPGPWDRRTRRQEQAYTGHRGIWIENGGENLVQRFRISPPFVHDLTVSDTTFGNVFRDGWGEDLCFDHHKTAPWGNLFTNIRTGRGSRPFMSGGGGGRGPYNGGAFNTWWNVRGDKPMALPDPDFAPAMNLVGFWSGGRDRSPACGQVRSGQWWITRASQGAQSNPGDLYVAQLQRRKDRGAFRQPAMRADAYRYATRTCNNWIRGARHQQPSWGH